LCSGWGLLSETLLPQGWRVSLYNIVDGRRGDVFPLPEEPRYLAYDPSHHVVYVTLEWIEAVGRIDLRSGEVELIQVDFRPWGLALDPEGNLFISHDWHFYYRAADGTLSREHNGLEGNHNVWDPFAGSLISGGFFEVRRRAFDPAQGLLGHLDWLRTNDISDLALSPDGVHVAFAQRHTTGVPDVSAAEFENQIGYWDTGTRPYSVAFDPTSTLLAASTETNFQIFDVNTHERLDTVSRPAADCSFFSDVSFSRGARLVTGRVHCGYPNTRTALVWRAVR
jgi:DNA-binding beta-propeller fold protein YncE